MDLVMCAAHGPQVFNDGTKHCPICARIEASCADEHAWPAYLQPNDTRQPNAPTTRDSDWIARELGDVEYRVGTFQGIQVECGPNFAPPSPAYWDGPVPVESLGRDQ